MRVALDGDAVIWDGWISTVGDVLPGPFRFDRAGYETAIAVADASRDWETAERRFARHAAELVDAEVRAALSWRGLRYLEIRPAGEGAVAVHLSAEYHAARWIVFVVIPIGDDPSAVVRLLSRWGPTKWPNVVWWSENEAAAFQPPPMAGRRWRMWHPVDM